MFLVAETRDHPNLLVLLFSSALIRAEQAIIKVAGAFGCRRVGGIKTAPLRVRAHLRRALLAHGQT